MTRKYKKPGKNQQFTISPEKSGHLIGKRKKKPILKQYTDAEREQFDRRREQSESTWSKIDRATIKKQCLPGDVFD